MAERELYDTALREVKELAADVIEQCSDFAYKNDYDKEWVLERFQEQFSLAKRDFLKLQRASKTAILDEKLEFNGEMKNEKLNFNKLIKGESPSYSES